MADISSAWVQEEVSRALFTLAVFSNHSLHFLAKNPSPENFLFLSTFDKYLISFPVTKGILKGIIEFNLLLISSMSFAIPIFIMQLILFFIFYFLPPVFIL